MKLIDKQVKVLDTEYARRLNIVGQIGTVVEEFFPEDEFDVMVEFGKDDVDFFTLEEVEIIL